MTFLTNQVWSERDSFAELRRHQTPGIGLETLFMVPSIYVLVARAHRRIEDEEVAGELDPATAG
ncbi:MAG: hypothetical protein ACRD3J_15140 [Thermoanaerobaculia bacterium]